MAVWVTSPAAARRNGQQMGKTIDGILPLALGVAISPVPIIAIILMLITPRARANGAGFVLGWVLGLAAAGGNPLAIAHAARAPAGGGPSTPPYTVTLVLRSELLPPPPQHCGGRPPRGRGGGGAAETAGIVEDYPERGIRRPIDLLRVVFGAAAVALLAGGGVVAGATATGAETDIAAAGHRLPGALLTLLGLAAALALLVLPVALAVRQLTRRESRRLAEAVVTRAVAVALVVAAHTLPRRPPASHPYHAPRLTRGGARCAAPP